MYKIKLSKCAYIFDNSATTYKHSREQAEQDHKKQTILKEYYNSAEKRSEWIPATKKRIKFCNGKEAQQIQIFLNGLQFNLNALQIAETRECAEIYNNKKTINFENFNSLNFNKFIKNHIYSNNFKTLYFENFTNKNDLGYIRAYFKNNCYKFIIDNKNNLYTAEGIEHKPTTRAEIMHRLELTSGKAKKEFCEVLDFLQDRSNQATGGAKND